jgi:hypothetical protein
VVIALPGLAQDEATALPATGPRLSWRVA